MNDRLAWWEEIPLGLALLAQSYVVGLWYYASIRGATWWADLFVAVLAGLALDLIVVTTVMGRRAGRSSGWSWATSLGAFGCSALIALDRYGWEWRSGLHIAFPLVVFLYSQHLATPRKRSVSADVETATQPLEAPDELEPEPRSEEQALAWERPSGFVYIFRSDVNGSKIGCARDVQARYRQVAPPLPFAIEIAHTIETDDMYATESRMHRYFEAAGKRLGGEWFKLTSVDLSTLKSIPGGALDQALDQALELLTAKGLRDVEFDGAFWLQQATAKKPLEASAPGQALLDELLALPLPLEVVGAPLVTEQVALEPIVLSAYRCPHCQAPLEKKQSVGAAVKNGYCPSCKAERLAAA